MGLKDSVAKNFFSRPKILACILNHVLHDGKQVVHPEQITDRCGEHLKIIQNADGTYRSDNRYRDRLFEYDSGDEKLLVALEFQTRNDRKMVMREMEYDGRQYKRLLATGQFHRIINIVLSFDRSRSSCPTTLEEMFASHESIAGGHFFNYGYTGLNIYDMAEKMDEFPCEELQEVLYLFKCEREHRLFMGAFENGGLKASMSRDAAMVCAVFLGLDVRIDDDSEEIDMCKAVRDFRRKCINEGRKLEREENKALWLEEDRKLGEEEGRKLEREENKPLWLEEGRKRGEEEGRKRGEEEGRKRGEERTIQGIVARLFNMKFEVPEICNLIGAPENVVQELVLSLQH